VPQRINWREHDWLSSVSRGTEAEGEGLQCGVCWGRTRSPSLPLNEEKDGEEGHDTHTVDRTIAISVDDSFALITDSASGSFRKLDLSPIPLLAHFSSPLFSCLRQIMEANCGEIF
jgi:hypothetical protein